ncbi:MAG: hypothetical protein U0V73_16290 [Acidimicrobiia bacterium]
MTLAVDRVEADDLTAFLELPFRSYAGNPSWVPPFLPVQHHRLTTPSAREQRALYVAERDGRVVGRVGAATDAVFDAFHRSRTGWVGFFECDDDQATATALFDAADRWLREQGCERALGPSSFATIEPCGLLVEGFERPPAVDTSYNPPWYERLWRGAGWVPYEDLLGFTVDAHAPLVVTEREQTIASRLQARLDFAIGRLAGEELRTALHAFFSTRPTTPWGHLPLYWPLTAPEVDAFAGAIASGAFGHDALFVLDRGTGRAIGCAVWQADLNEVMLEARDPAFVWPADLPARLRRARTIRGGAGGFAPEYQMLGASLLVMPMLDEVRASFPDLETVEISWVAASNIPMLKLAQRWCGPPTRRWRVFSRALHADGRADRHADRRNASALA